MPADLDRLQPRELEVLRLLAQGHDAKSVSSVLGISVHAVNERLRDARRKLHVSSSREAARLLYAHERSASDDDFSVAKKIELESAAPKAPPAAPLRAMSWVPAHRHGAVIFGGLVLLVLTALLLASGISKPNNTPRPQAEPQLLVHSVLSQGRYPAEALKRGEQGIARYRVAVSPKGRVEACEIVQSSGSASLDAATCEALLKRARFIPAAKPNGEPTRAYSDGSLMWVLQREHGKPAGRG